MAHLEKHNWEVNFHLAIQIVCMKHKKVTWVSKIYCLCLCLNPNAPKWFRAQGVSEHCLLANFWHLDIFWQHKTAKWFCDVRYLWCQLFWWELLEAIEHGSNSKLMNFGSFRILFSSRWCRLLSRMRVFTSAFHCHSFDSHASGTILYVSPFTNGDELTDWDSQHISWSSSVMLHAMKMQSFISCF